jgi:predicted permease
MSLFGRRSEASVEEELRLHLDRMIEENEWRGMTADAARADALRRFGDMHEIREACVNEDELAGRRRNRLERVLSWGQDLKYGLRVLRRSPVYAIVIVITLAFGIGANAIVFSALSPYFVRALPFDSPDRLVHLFTVNTAAGFDRDRFSLPQLEDLRGRARGFEALGGYVYGARALSGDVGAEQVTVGRLTSNAFDVLGARAALGRTFIAGESGPGGSAVVVLGWGLWQRVYAGSEAVIGGTIRLDGQPHTVIGVMPAEFNFPFGGVKLWTPMVEEGTETARDVRNVLVFGRLADGWTVDAARADLDGVWRDLAVAHPDVDGRLDGINVLGMREALNFAYDILRVAFTALIGAVLFVLLVACANIVGLGLARAVARRREVAVRAALGAPRFRLIRQFLLESAVLALAGGGLGLLLAHSFMRVAGPVFPEDLYAIGEFGVDGTVALLTAGVTVLAAVLIGVMPALTVTGGRPGDALREAGRGGHAAIRSSRTRSLLVVGELALGLTLVVGAGLMTRSLTRVTAVPLGFEPDSLLTLELTAPQSSYPDAGTWSAYWNRVTEAVQSVAGVTSAASTGVLPLNHETPQIGFDVPGRPADGALPVAEWFAVSPGYFETMRIEILAGRDFDRGDAADGERVAMINRTFADRHFAGGSAVGLMLRLSSGDSLRSYRVVGVVDDVRHSEITAAPPPQVYVSIEQSNRRRRFVVARTAAGASAVAAGVRDAVATIDADVPTNWLRPMSDIMTESVGPFAAMSMVLAVFGTFALLLAAIGLYGLIAWSVSQRQKEFGVRLALGAEPGRLVRAVMRDGIRLAAIGITVGLIMAMIGGRVLGSLLFGVSATDPVAVGTAIIVFVASALLATAIPAARASRADPVSALRAE